MALTSEQKQQIVTGHRRGGNDTGSPEVQVALLSARIEELSKQAEVEDKFVKFLKYIEMLHQSDPKKLAGQKLIQMIFSVDKYKAY